MLYAIAAFLTGLFGFSLLPADLGALEAALARETGAGAVRILATPQPTGRLFDRAALRLELTNVDVKRLPLQALLAVPEPRTVKGRLERFDIHIEHALLDGATAAAIDFESHDLTYDLLGAATGRGLRVSGAGRQTVRVLVRDGGLDDLARATFPELGAPHLTFEAGELVARTDVPLLFATFPVTIRGQLGVREGGKLYIPDPRIDTGRLELSDSLLRTITARLDPLLDLEQSLGFPLPIDWHTIVVGDGEMTLGGDVLAVDAPRDKPSFQPRWRYLDEING